MIAFLYATLLTIALVLMYFGYKQYLISDQLMDNGIKTKATVVDLIELIDSDGTTYKPVFEYEDWSDNKYSFESTISSYPAPYKIGDKVDIVYSKDKESQKVISYWGLYRWTIILLSIAAPLFVIGGGYFLFRQSIH